MKKNRARLVIVITALALAVCHAHGAAPQLRPIGEALAAAATVTTNRFPDADSVLTYNLVRESYNPDGTGESWDDEYLTILTEKGRRDATAHSFFFNTSYGTTSVVRAEIVKPDGRVVPVDIARQSRVMIEPGQMSANIYDPNNKILSLAVPGLEIGDTLHLLSYNLTSKARVPDSWSDFTVFEYTTPILALDYEIAAPPSLPLRHHLLRAPVSNTVAYAASALPDGRTLHRWQVRDVPRVFAEPSMPPLHTQVQRLISSTLEDWPAVSRWYWNLALPRLNATNPEMTNTVRRIIEDAAGRDEQIRRLFTFVSQQVRYMGITDEDVAPGYEPHDVAMTFNNRYGVCRDKAALLVALLRLAGIDAFPVLIHAGAKLDPEIPLPFFNHAIVAAAREPGREDGNAPYILMDPTDENTRDLLPSYLCNRSYLVATPSGDPLRVSPVVPAASNLLHVASQGVADAGGTLILNTAIRFEGINDTAYRNFLARQQPEQRRKYFEGILKASLSGAELLDFNISPADLQDTSQPLAVTLSSRILDWPVRGDGVDVAAMPWLGTSLGYVNFILGPTGLRQRKYTLETGIACGVEETVTIAIGDTFGPAERLPSPLSLQRSGITFTMETGVSGNTLSGTLAYRIEQPEFTPTEYLDLRLSLQQMETAARQRPAFAATAGSFRPDLRVLSATTTIDLADSHNWTRTETRVTQILTYAGKKRAAEVTVGYNPVWQTADIISATVANPDGAVYTISDKEINRMDASWVAGAPRYPAAKALVANLPGVETGSVITTTIRITQSNAPRFTLQAAFGGFDPVEQETITITAPEKMRLEILTLNDAAITLSTTNIGGRAIRTWSAAPQPATRNEPGIAPWFLFRPTLLAAAGDTAHSLLPTRRAFLTAMRDQRQAAVLARQLTRHAANDDEKIRLIRDHVLRQVRLAGPSFATLPADLSVSSADTTLADGYGHSADRAILLAAMLRAAGFDAEPVLVNNAPQRPADIYGNVLEFENPAAYGETLVRVDRRPGLWRRTFSSRRPLPLYLGDGDQYSVIGATALDDRPVLDLYAARGRVAVDEELRDRSQTEWHLALDADGTALITVTNWYFGSACGLFRRQYTEMPPEERRRHHLELVSGVYRSAEAVGNLVTALDVYPGYRAFTVRAPRYAVREADSLTLLLPSPPAAAIPLQGDRRFTPIHIAARQDALWSCTVTLPPQTVATPVIPPPLTLALPENHGRYSATVSRERLPDGSQRLCFRRTTTTAPFILPAEQYPTLLEINRLISNPAQHTLVITLPAAGSDNKQPQLQP